MGINIITHYIDWVPGGTVFPQVARFGLNFLCPHCLEQRIGVLFNPIMDPDDFLAKNQWMLPDSKTKRWNRTGDTFDTLTLSPSIDVSQHGHWHGHIVDGNVGP